MESATYDQVIVAAISVWIIQRLKAWSLFPSIKDGADKVLRGLAVIAAMLSAAGILVTANWNGVEGTLSILVTGLSVKNGLLFVWLTLKSLISQELIWRVVKSSKQVSLS